MNEILKKLLAAYAAYWIGYYVTGAVLLLLFVWWLLS